jgi:hypothetical protein
MPQATKQHRQAGHYVLEDGRQGCSNPRSELSLNAHAEFSYYWQLLCAHVFLIRASNASEITLLNQFTMVQILSNTLNQSPGVFWRKRVSEE